MKRITLHEARSIIALGYSFENWEGLAQFAREVTRLQSDAARFEDAVEAVITGEAVKLESLLQEHPELIRVRSMRKHRATLLHYIGANGVEGYRQKTPPNAVQIAQMLLKAGADVDAEANLYGRDTTLGLVATSIFPVHAGVQIPLIECLLDAGADRDGGGGGSIVNGCLANGRPQAAEFLANRGARLNLEGAAGVGYLDRVKGFLGDHGELKANATRIQMESGFMWACEYGRIPVIEYLLDHGVNVDTQVHGMTGLHWAVIGGNLDTIKLLLKRKASMEVKNRHGGTVLGTAVWAAIHSDPIYRWPSSEADRTVIIRASIDAGAKVEPGSGLKEQIEQILGHKEI